MRRQRRKRRLSMTSLIDVIFLLLLFFMLSSTFTRFAEVELAAAGAGGDMPSTAPIFLSVAPNRLNLNGVTTSLATLSDALTKYRSGDAPVIVLVAMKGPVTAQRLTDVLAALRRVSGVRVTVLEAA